MKATSHLIILLFVLAAGTALGHHCPYDWNIGLSKELSFKETSVSDVIDKVNAAVREQTKGRIKWAVILDTTPVKITQTPADSPLAGEMAVLIKRYHKEMAPIIAKGAQGYETCPVTVTFPRKFTIACILKMMGEADAGMGYEEKKEGAVFSRRPKELECRAYKVSDALLKRVEEKRKAGQIHPDFKPVPIVFAQEGEVTMSAMVGDGPRSYKGESVLDGVTLYLPEKKIILILETPQGHKKVQDNLKKQGFWQE